MSRTRPPNPREWSRLQHHCTFLTPRTRALLPPAINNHLPGKPNNHSLAHPRLLHTTPSRGAARPAPSTRIKAFQVRDTGRPGSLGQQPPKALPEEDLPPRNSVAHAQLQAHLQIFQKNAFPLVSAMLKDGVIDKNMTPKKFKRIGTALLQNAYTSHALSPDLIRNIARAEDVDLDTILEIGHVIAGENVQAARWVLASCLRAGSLVALLIAAARTLNGCHDGGNVYNATTVRELPSKTLLSRIAVIAQSKNEPHNSDPRVKLLYAKYLGLRGQYEQGIAVVQEVLQLIEPSRVYRKPTLTINNSIEPPWQLLAWLKRELRKTQITKERGRGDRKGEANDVLSQEEVDALRLGAIEYQDPIALVHYARYIGEESGINDYETYMGQAAAAGNKDACRKLANFYYLISVGKYPQLGTRDAKSTKLQATAETTTEDIDVKETESSKGALSTLLSYFGPRPRHEYRALAMEWYHVALAQGCFGSGLHLSLLHGQDGNHKAAGAVFQEVEGLADQMPDAAQKLIAALREGTNVPTGLPLDV